MSILYYNNEQLQIEIKKLMLENKITQRTIAKRLNLLPQLWYEFDLCTAARLAVVQRAGRDIAAEHLLQTHGLSAELQGVRGVLLGLAALVLHRVRLPQAISAF